MHGKARLCVALYGVKNFIKNEQLPYDSTCKTSSPFLDKEQSCILGPEKENMGPYWLVGMQF